MDLVPRVLVLTGTLLVIVTIAYGVVRLLKGTELVRAASFKDWLQESSMLSARLFSLFMILGIPALIVSVDSK